MTPFSPPLAIAIPAYQAQKWIGDVVRRSLPFAETVLVVDDGSTDATAQEAREAGAEVLRQAENQGKGAALRRAFDELFRRGFERVVTLDADGQHRPEEIPKLLAVAAEADLVLGTRQHLFAQMGGLRRVSNRLSSRLISRLAKTPLQDVQTGFRLYTRRLLEQTGFPEDRFQAESAVVIRAGLRGLRIVSVPVELGHADGRGSSHYRAVVDGLRTGWAVARARMEGRGA